MKKGTKFRKGDRCICTWPDGSKRVVRVATKTVFAPKVGVIWQERMDGGHVRMMQEEVPAWWLSENKKGLKDVQE